MFKIFLVDSNTQLSTEVNALMATGMDYLPTFGWGHNQSVEV